MNQWKNKAGCQTIKTKVEMPRDNSRCSYGVLSLAKLHTTYDTHCFVAFFHLHDLNLAQFLSIIHCYVSEFAIHQIPNRERLREKIIM